MFTWQPWAGVFVCWHLKTMSSLSGVCWKLDRYARFVCNGTNECGQWKESHSLANAQPYIRGLSRNDSLLFMYKFKVETRRFRVRFCKDDTSKMSGKEVCIKAIKKLSEFFPIKTSLIGNGTTNSTQLNDKTKDKHLDLAQSKPKIPNMEVESSTEFCGEVTLGAVAQAVLRGQSLPLAYHQHQQNLDIIPQLLTMCLGDPMFPAFVEAVETAVRAVVDSRP